jgi:hypothetical protein
MSASILTAALTIKGDSVESTIVRSTNNAKDSINSSNTINSSNIDALDDSIIGLSVDSIAKMYELIVVQADKDKLDDIVMKNAAKIYPYTRKFLDNILEANNKYSSIFPVPVQYSVGLFIQESGVPVRGSDGTYSYSILDTLAVSRAGAIGIAQFMRETAKVCGIKVYSRSDAPELYDLECKLTSLNRELSSINYLVADDLKNNRFDALKKHKLAYDAKLIIRENTFNSFRDGFLRKVKTDPEFRLKDERINPKIMIDKSAYLLAVNARNSRAHFGGSQIHNVIRALAAYNAGIVSVRENYGLPRIPETVDYVRKIMCYADRMLPGDENANNYLVVFY